MYNRKLKTTLDEELRIKGGWYLPETPEIEVAGELLYSPVNGVILELQGDLHAPQDGHFHPPISQNELLINGITVKGDPVSLFSCDVINGKVSIGEYIGIPIAMYRIKFAFIGIHFLSEEDIKFNKLAVRFTHLDSWIDDKSFYLEYPVVKDGQSDFGEATLQYIKPPPHSVSVNNSLVSFTIEGPSIDRPVAGEYILSQKAWVTIQKNTGETFLETHFVSIRLIQDFLSLGVGHPVFPIEVVGYTDSKKLKISNEKVVNLPIYIFYSRPWQETITRQIDPSQMLYTLKTLEGRLDSSILNWFTSAEKIKPILDIYFSLLYREQIYSEMRFLSITQCIESYHRRMVGGKYLPDDLYRSGLYKLLIQAIPADLDKGFKESLLKGKLYYANEYSLRKRLVDLTTHLAEYLDIYFLTETNGRKLFIDRVCNTRNYLTHLDEELKFKAATTGEEQHELYRKLRLVLDSFLLETIGFDREQINDMLRKHYFYRNYFTI